MKYKKPTVTIAIPAYNEAENIGNLLDALLRQTYLKIQLENILVYTDGSTDNTVKIVEEMTQKSSMIKLVIGKKQRGKFYRLNQIYKANESDVLIVLDADIGLCGNDFIENFSLAIISDNHAQLVSAHELPLLPKDFIGRVITSTYVMWDSIRLSIPQRDHVQNLYARATAYRGTFAKTLYIPDEATEERLYLYLMAKKTNGFRYTYNASIVYWPVNTIYDFVKLSERAFGRPQPAVSKLFGYDTTHYYTIPRKYKIIGILQAFRHNPIFTPLGIILGVILSKSTTRRKTKDSQLWEVSVSSKKKIVL